MSKLTLRQRAALRREAAKRAERVADQAAAAARHAPHGMLGKLRELATRARTRALQLGRAAR